MLSTAQLDLLDAYCGAKALALRADLRHAHERVRSLQRRAAELREMAGARERELDLVRFELGEIEAAAPDEREQGDLLAERERLRHLEALKAAALAGAEAIAPEAGAGAAELLAQANQQLEHVAGV